MAASENEIDGAIVVEIGGDQARAGGVEAETAFRGDVGEGAVAIVAPENIVRGCFASTRRRWAAW